MEPILKIIAEDGTEYEAGVKYARGYDGANAEAVEVYGLKAGTFKLVCTGWTGQGSQLSGCGAHSFGGDV